MLFPVCLSHEFRFLRLACLLLCFGVALGFGFACRFRPLFLPLYGVGPVQFGMLFPVCLSHEFPFLRLACLLLCFGVAFGSGFAFRLGPSCHCGGSPG